MDEKNGYKKANDPDEFDEEEPVFAEFPDTSRFKYRKPIPTSILLGSAKNVPPFLSAPLNPFSNVPRN